MIFFTLFLIKRLEIDSTPSCTHFYPSRMDWTDRTVPYDGFSFSYDWGFFFCVFFFYFSCITRIYAIFIANWILYVDYYILHTRCYRCRIAILFGFTVWLYYTVMALLGYLMFFGLPLRCGGWDILPNRPSRPGKEWMDDGMEI